MNRSLLLGSTALVGIAMLAAPASAQMYTTGPGFAVSVEGRYMWNAGDSIKNFAYSGTPEFFDSRCGVGCAEYDPYGTSKTNVKGFGGKAMLGYRFGMWDVGVGVQAARLKDKDSVTALNEDDDPLTDNLKSTLKVGAIDFEAGYNMPVGGMSQLRIFGGVRAASLKQKNSGTINDIDFNGFTYDYMESRKTKFTGIGPRLGLNGQFAVAGGFHVFGGVSGALLYGKFKDRHAYSFAPFTQSFSYEDRDKKKLVGNVEGEIGLGYTFGTATQLSLQVGYRGSAWLGAAAKGSTIAFEEQKKSGDYLLHGPFARLAVLFGSAAPAPMASAPPPPPPVMPGKGFIVFFDFDRSNITAQAQATINDAIAAAKAGGSTRVTLTGHTDRSGSEQYNQALSVRRGEAVKAAMIRGGIPANAIVVIGRGESVPLVPTADGVREPQNRRVEILI